MLGPSPLGRTFQSSNGMTILHVLSETHDHLRVEKLLHGSLYGWIAREEKCCKCGRQAEFWGNLAGKCKRCLHRSLRNDVETTLRCLARRRETRACIQHLPNCCRALVVDYLSGCVIQFARELQLYVNMSVWKSVLLGFCETFESDPEEDDDMFFSRCVASRNTPLVWKLQLSFFPRYSTCGAPGDNLIHYLLQFLASSDASGVRC
jgi:hypothetical protein